MEIAAGFVKPLADSTGLLIKAENSSYTVRIFHDQRRGEQALINPVNNAVKFTEKGGVCLRYGQDNDTVCVSVQDKGIGIKQENMDVLFQTFWQIEAGLPRRYEDTGLGFSISKGLVELMGRFSLCREWRAGDRREKKLATE